MCQRVEYFFGHTIAEIFLLRVVTHIYKWQHSDTFFGNYFGLILMKGNLERNRNRRLSEAPGGMRNFCLFNIHSIHANQFLHILKGYFFYKISDNPFFVKYIIVYCFGYPDSPDRRGCLKSRGNVNAIAKNIPVFEYHFTQVYAHAKFKSLNRDTFLQDRAGAPNGICNG